MNVVGTYSMVESTYLNSILKCFQTFSVNSRIKMYHYTFYLLIRYFAYGIFDLKIISGNPGIHTGNSISIYLVYGIFDLKIIYGNPGIQIQKGNFSKPYPIYLLFSNQYLFS